MERISQKNTSIDMSNERTAIDQTTEEDSVAAFAIKGRDYKCPSCKELLIVRKGQKNRHHFAHHSLDKEDKCEYYDGPNMNSQKYTDVAESREHIQGKEYMCKIKKEKIIIVSRPCATGQCNTTDEFIIKKLDSANEELICEEPMLLADGRTIQPDVKLIDKHTREVLQVYEIYKSSRTLETNRPDLTWFEFDQKELRDTFLDPSYNNHETVFLKCIRQNIKCQRCVHEENILFDRIQKQKEEIEARKQKQREEREQQQIIREKIMFKIKLFKAIANATTDTQIKNKSLNSHEMFLNYQTFFCKRGWLSERQLFYLDKPYYHNNKEISFEYWQKHEEEVLGMISGKNMKECQTCHKKYTKNYFSNCRICKVELCEKNCLRYDGNTGSVYCVNHSSADD